MALLLVGAWALAMSAMLDGLRPHLWAIAAATIPPGLSLLVVVGIQRAWPPRDLKA